MGIMCMCGFNCHYNDRHYAAQCPHANWPSRKRSFPVHPDVPMLLSHTASGERVQLNISVRMQSSRSYLASDHGQFHRSFNMRAVAAVSQACCCRWSLYSTLGSMQPRCACHLQMHHGYKAKRHLVPHLKAALTCAQTLLAPMGLSWLVRRRSRDSAITAEAGWKVQVARGIACASTAKWSDIRRDVARTVVRALGGKKCFAGQPSSAIDASSSTFLTRFLLVRCILSTLWQDVMSPCVIQQA